ncbi:MAG: hypothetical protein Q9164_007751, partial [Protoblastenia rupestris]
METTTSEMLKSSRSCDSCSRIISRPQLLEKACSPIGLDVTQSVEEFLQALELECYICLTIYDFSERYKASNDSGTFYHLRRGETLFKNVKCRKSGLSEDPITKVELPKDYHFDRMIIILGSINAAEDIYFDVQALDGKVTQQFEVLFKGSRFADLLQLDDPAAMWV